MSEENSSPEDVTVDGTSDEYVPETDSFSDNCDEPQPKRRKQGETSTVAVNPTIRKSHDCVEPISRGYVKLKNPSAITSTNLRKYVATVTQIISLEKEELEWVADHLGHNIEVHREFYRLQESTLEVSKVSKLLLAIDNGCVYELAGKK